MASEAQARSVGLVNEAMQVSAGASDTERHVYLKFRKDYLQRLIEEALSLHEANGDVLLEQEVIFLQKMKRFVDTASADRYLHFCSESQANELIEAGIRAIDARFLYTINEAVQKSTGQESSERTLKLLYAAKLNVRLVRSIDEGFQAATTNRQQQDAQRHYRILVENVILLNSSIVENDDTAIDLLDSVIRNSEDVWKKYKLLERLRAPA